MQPETYLSVGSNRFLELLYVCTVDKRDLNVVSLFEKMFHQFVRAAI